MLVIFLLFILSFTRFHTQEEEHFFLFYVAGFFSTIENFHIPMQGKENIAFSYGLARRMFCISFTPNFGNFKALLK